MKKVLFYSLITNTHAKSLGCGCHRARPSVRGASVHDPDAWHHTCWRDDHKLHLPCNELKLPHANEEGCHLSALVLSWCSSGNLLRNHASSCVFNGYRYTVIARLGWCHEEERHEKARHCLLWSVQFSVVVCGMLYTTCGLVSA